LWTCLGAWPLWKTPIREQIKQVTVNLRHSVRLNIQPLSQAKFDNCVQSIEPLEEVRVEMAEMKIERIPVVLVTSVGSCVAICIHEPMNRFGGLAHVMLPRAASDSRFIPSKYADTAVPLMVDAIEKFGGNSRSLSAKIAGGADMFSTLRCGSLKIGQENIQATRQALQTEGIRLVGEDVGGTSGRRVSFNVSDGSVIVQSLNGVEKKL
jgi:chemotaxis protein CheD